MKKKNVAGRLLGYCPKFSKHESQYNKLNYNTGLDRHGLRDMPGRAAGALMVGHDTAKRGHDTTGWATIQPATWLATRAGVRQCTCMALPLG